MLNTEKFTGKAEIYAKSRPGYPDAALAYLRALAPPGAVWADIGAGTGKFTEQLARDGCQVYAVEPNADMRAQLTATLAPFPHARVIDGTAEATTLPDHCADIITCAQALHWFDPDQFRAECLRIGKPGVIVAAVYNNTPGGSSVTLSGDSTDVFFSRPVVKEFPNPIFYTRENWLRFMTSHSHSPLPSDPGYDAYMAEMSALFDRESADGLLRQDVVTKVYSERM